MRAVCVAVWLLVSAAVAAPFQAAPDPWGWVLFAVVGTVVFVVGLLAFFRQADEP